MQGEYNMAGLTKKGNIYYAYFQSRENQSGREFRITRN